MQKAPSPNIKFVFIHILVFIFTLHVGLGTFRPVNEESIEDHQMHSEWYSVSEETAKLINETRAAGHRVIAVGTTSCRTLESVWAKYGKIVPCSGNTSSSSIPASS